MYRKTKNQLIAIIIVLIIVTIAAWYLLIPRTKIIPLNNLVEISYNPPSFEECACKSGQECVNGVCRDALPNFTFKFSSPVPSSVKSGTAVLKSFTLSSSDATTSALANFIIGVLIKNNVPFTPVLSAGNTVITSNTMPAAVKKIIVQPVTFSGVGTMEISIPPS